MNEKPMSVLMTSASIGERASGSVQDGGFFSLYFKTAMESHFSKFKTNVSWNDIFNDAMKAAKIPSTKRKMIYSGVEFYRYTINDGFEPKNSKKSFTEYELQLHYDKTNEWI